MYIGDKVEKTGYSWLEAYVTTGKKLGRPPPLNKLVLVVWTTVEGAGPGRKWKYLKNAKAKKGLGACLKWWC
jgi:hypothetical protein